MFTWIQYSNLMERCYWIFCCFYFISFHFTRQLNEKLSSIALNAYEAEFVGPTIKFSCLAAFAVLFFVLRILIVPYLWAEFTWILYKETADPDSIINAANCFPANYIYVVLVFGFLFHGLNFFCKCFFFITWSPCLSFAVF